MRYLNREFEQGVHLVGLRLQVIVVRGLELQRGNQPLLQLLEVQVVGLGLHLGLVLRLLVSGRGTVTVLDGPSHLALHIPFLLIQLGGSLLQRMALAGDRRKPGKPVENRDGNGNFHIFTAVVPELVLESSRLGALICVVARAPAGVQPNGGQRLPLGRVQFQSTTELVETGSTCQAGIDVSMTSSSSTGQNIRSARVILWLSYMLYVFVRSYWRSAKSASI